MARFVLSSSAEKDILSILAWTHREFGENARLRYESLVVQAIVDIAVEPHRFGVICQDDIAPGLLVYHLRHSRLNVGDTMVRVSKPRHFLLFRVSNKGIEVGRVLHDSMDLQRHIPDDFLES